jgi:hypothetical protein
MPKAPTGRWRERGEVSHVDGSDRSYAGALREENKRGVGEIQRAIVICGEDILYALQRVVSKVRHGKSACREGGHHRAGMRGEQMPRLGEYGQGGQKPCLVTAEPINGLQMMVVVALEQRYQRASVKDDVCHVGSRADKRSVCAPRLCVDRGRCRSRRVLGQPSRGRLASCGVPAARATSHARGPPNRGHHRHRSIHPL